MSTMVIIAVGRSSDTVGSVRNRYGIVDGGGTLSMSFAKIKAELMADVAEALGPALSGGVIVTLDLGNIAYALSGVNSAYMDGVVAQSNPGTIATLQVNLSSADIRSRLAAPASTVTLSPADAHGRLLVFLGSLGTGVPANVNVSVAGGGGGVVQAQAGVAF